MTPLPLPTGATVEARDPQTGRPTRIQYASGTTFHKVTPAAGQTQREACETAAAGLSIEPAVYEAKAIWRTDMGWCLRTRLIA